MSVLLANDCLIPAEHAARLVDPIAYSTGHIFQTYDWLREHQPLGVAHPEGFDPFWVVTRHADVMEVSRDNRLYPYGERSSILVDQFNDQRQREITGRPYFVRSLVQIDEPEHMALRQITQPWFMPAVVAKRAQRIGVIADATVAKCQSLGAEIDFAHDVALNYPLEVVMDILGVPTADFGYMLKLTQETFGPTDPETSRLLEQATTAQIAEMSAAIVADFEQYFNVIADQRRANPGDDLASLIANAQVSGHPLTQEQQTGYFMIVATAGHDTTSSSTSGAMWALATQPGLLEQLQAEPALIPAFVEESIRWTTPVRHFMRSPAQDTILGGRQLRQNDWLMLCYASANRDAAVFEDPYRFRLDRKVGHVAFGYGAHLCLGMHLARLEMRILWEKLLPRIKHVEMNGDPQHVQATFVTGLKHLPIRWELRDQ